MRKGHTMMLCAVRASFPGPVCLAARMPLRCRRRVVTRMPRNSVVVRVRPAMASNMLVVCESIVESSTRHRVVLVHLLHHTPARSSFVRLSSRGRMHNPGRPRGTLWDSSDMPRQRFDFGGRAVLEA